MKNNPKSKRPRRTQRKRNTGRRRYYAKLSTTERSLFPARKNVTLVYTGAYINNVSTTSILWTQYVANGMYDTTASGAGSPPQPMGFDQLTPFYARYRVNAVKVIIEGMVKTALQPVCLLLGHADDGSVYPSGLRQARESKQYMCKVVNSEKPFRIVKYYPMNVIHGRTPLQNRMEDNYVGVLESSGGSNPADTAFVRIGTINLDETTSTNVAFRVTLIFYATVSELRQLAVS